MYVNLHQFMPRDSQDDGPNMQKQKDFIKKYPSTPYHMLWYGGMVVWYGIVWYGVVWHVAWGGEMTMKDQFQKRCCPPCRAKTRVSPKGQNLLWNSAFIVISPPHTTCHTTPYHRIPYHTTIPPAMVWCGWFGMVWYGVGSVVWCGVVVWCGMVVPRQECICPRLLYWLANPGPHSS